MFPRILNKQKRPVYSKLSQLDRHALPPRLTHITLSPVCTHTPPLWARAATAPMPICRACACRRVLVSWMFLALASGRICCLLRPCNGRALWGGGTQTALAAVVWSHWATPRASGFVCMFVVGTCTWLCVLGVFSAGVASHCTRCVPACLRACVLACCAHAHAAGAYYRHVLGPRNDPRHEYANWSHV